MTNVSRPIHLHLNAVSNCVHHKSSFENSFRDEDNSSESSSSSSLPSQVMPYLFVGNQEQTNRETLSRLNISYILSLQSLPRLLMEEESKEDRTSDIITSPTCNPNKPIDFYTYNENKQIRCKFFNISDTFEQLLGIKIFEEASNFIDEARKNDCNILIHCNAGISRSPTIAIAYLMKYERLYLQDAYNFVKRCRPQISPNLNFMGQLVSYENKLIRTIRLARALEFQEDNDCPLGGRSFRYNLNKKDLDNNYHDANSENVQGIVPFKESPRRRA